MSRIPPGFSFVPTPPNWPPKTKKKGHAKHTHKAFHSEDHESRFVEHVYIPDNFMSEATLDRCIAVEVLGWEWNEKERCWHVKTSPAIRFYEDQHHPTTDDAQALFAFDEAARIVEATTVNINVYIETAVTPRMWGADLRWGEIIEAEYGSNDEDDYSGYEMVDTAALTRPRALCECALLAVRVFRENKKP